jgi:hypothetical protein
VAFAAAMGVALLVLTGVGAWFANAVSMFVGFGRASAGERDA